MPAPEPQSRLAGASRHTVVPRPVAGEGTWTGMSLMRRLAMLFRAKANKALDRAEDPREMLDYSYERQLELLQQVRRGLADVATSRRRVELQLVQLQQSGAKLQGQAQQALAAGREDLAREALTRRAAVASQMGDLQGQQVSLQAEQDKLTVASQRLQAQVEAFRTRKETIKAAYTAADAETRIREAVTGTPRFPLRDLRCSLALEFFTDLVVWSLPAGLGDAGQFAAVRHGAEADPAQAEPLVDGPRPPAAGAPRVAAHLELRRPLLLDDQRLLCHCHPSLKGKPSRRSKERPSASLIAVVTTVMSMPRCLSTLSGSISWNMTCSVRPNV